VESQIQVDPLVPSQTIPILSLDMGTRYLGIYVTCSSATKPMEDHVWSKALLYTSAFQWTHMAKREATVLYHSCFLPALTYSFPVTWMPDKNFERIHHLSTSTILNKMGYHHNLPCSLVFAPHDLGRVGLTNLIHEQGTQQLIILIWHMHVHSPLSTAIKMLIQTYPLWAGISEYVLTDTQPCP